MRLRAALAGLAAYLLFAAFVVWLYAPDRGSLVALTTCPPPASEPARAVSVPFYLTLDRPETIRLCGTIVGEPELLVLPRLSGNAVDVRVDGRSRHRVAAPDRPGSFWIQPQLVPLDGIGAGAHEVEIELHGLYDIGVRLPPYLTTWNTGGRRAALLAWLTDDFVTLAAGVNLGVGLLLLTYGLQRLRHRAEAILFGCAAIAAVFFIADFTPGGGVAGAEVFLIRRKLSLAGAFLFAATIAAGLELATRVRRRIGKGVLVYAGVLALVALVAPSQQALKTLSDLAALTYLPLTLYGMALAIRHLEPVFAALWVFFGAASLHLLVNLFTGTGYLFLLQYGMIAGALAAGARTTTQLASMAQELARASRAALTDPLTGARNRAFCDSLRPATTDTLVLFDFDDFKSVNDRHGHERGDRLLVDFVRATLLRLRGTDHVIRLGGDEFALLLKSADRLSAEQVAAEVLETWAEMSPDLAASASYGIAEVGARGWETALAEADREMYAAKARRSQAIAP